MGSVPCSAIIASTASTTESAATASRCRSTSRARRCATLTETVKGAPESRPLENKDEDHYSERTRASPLNDPRTCPSGRPSPGVGPGPRRRQRSAARPVTTVAPQSSSVWTEGRGPRRPSRPPSPGPAGRSSPPAARRRARASRAPPTPPDAGSRARRGRRRARPAARGRAPRRAGTRLSGRYVRRVADHDVGSAAQSARQRAEQVAGVDVPSGRLDVPPCARDRRRVKVGGVQIGPARESARDREAEGAGAAAEIDHHRDLAAIGRQPASPTATDTRNSLRRRGTKTPGSTTIRRPANSAQPTTCSSGSPATRRSTRASSSAWDLADDTSIAASSSAKTHPARRSRATTVASSVTASSRIAPHPTIRDVSEATYINWAAGRLNVTDPVVKRARGGDNSTVFEITSGIRAGSSKSGIGWRVNAPGCGGSAAGCRSPRSSRLTSWEPLTHYSWRPCRVPTWPPWRNPCLRPRSLKCSRPRSAPSIR